MHEFMTVPMVAKVAFIYAGDDLAPGDKFMATPDDAKYLEPRGKAAPAPSPSAPSPSAPSPSAPSPSVVEAEPAPAAAAAVEPAFVAGADPAPAAAPARRTFARKTISRASDDVS